MDEWMDEAELRQRYAALTEQQKAHGKWRSEALLHSAGASAREATAAAAADLVAFERDAAADLRRRRESVEKRVADRRRRDPWGWGPVWAKDTSTSRRR